VVEPGMEGNKNMLKEDTQRKRDIGQTSGDSLLATFSCSMRFSASSMSLSFSSSLAST